MAKVIYFFARDDKYYQLSNFAGFGFELAGFKWRTMEHYFQGMKFEGTSQFEKIRNSGSPKQAKDLGQSRAVTIRQDWGIGDNGKGKNRLGVLLMQLRSELKSELS
jgi:predicted NAD-dependent protein-ADP-ribosyltransferase YbiA (DUF1768 family)